MGLVILKKKLVAAPHQPALSEFADQIDLVGQLTEDAAPILAEIKTLQEKLKPLAEAKAKLQESIDALELDDDFDKGVEIGSVFRVEVGKKGASRSITDMQKVRKLMGSDLFFKVATVALKDIDQYLTGPQRDEVIETKRGSRSYKVIKRV